MVNIKQIFCKKHIYKEVSREFLRSDGIVRNTWGNWEHTYYAVNLVCVKCGKKILKEVDVTLSK